MAERKKKAAKAAPEKGKEKEKKTGKEAPNWFLLFFKYLGIGVWWLLKGLWWVLRKTAEGIWLLSSEIVSFAAREGKERKRKKDKVPYELPQNIKTLETLSGSFRDFWRRLKASDSLIGIIVGARGSGKSAIALCMLEELQRDKDNCYAMGFRAKDLPGWIRVVEDIKEIENNSFVVIDEGGILFSSRESMSDSNKLLSEILFIARHKDLTILFISQNSSNIEINTLRQADFLILKKSSLLQKDFERKKISEIYEKYGDEFSKYRNMKGVSLVYSDEFVGFIHNGLPMFWSSRVSKGFR